MHFWQSFIDSKIIKHNFAINPKKQQVVEVILTLWKGTKKLYKFKLRLIQIWDSVEFKYIHIYFFFCELLAHTKFNFYDHNESHNKYIFFWKWPLREQNPKNEKLLAIISRKTSYIFVNQIQKAGETIKKSKI